MGLFGLFLAGLLVTQPPPLRWMLLAGGLLLALLGVVVGVGFDAAEPRSGVESRAARPD